ncbi:unnamed protein product [Cyprideis torosa]|uniref:Uncharacterized protein n=1 Tax=Cyprideis torosa TaxID=163714 RepID=A0A7R8W8C5_9CRUS|nr:unnamed protein product [Cyprideis torosa]CAG0883339.1 unnamed protein product [Cyprideis torosa]
MSANGHLPPSGAIVTEHDGAHLVSRIQNQRTTQEVTKVTRVIREIHHVPVNYDEHGGYHPDMSHDSSFSGGGPPPHPDGRGYESGYGHAPGVLRGGDPRSVYPPYLGLERPPTPPSPSERSESPPPEVGGTRPPYPQSGYAELDATLNPHGPLPSHSGSGVQWRDPDLREVIDFLGHPNPVVKANAAAYLQHLSYMNNPMKNQARALGAISPLVLLLDHDVPEVARNACGALRNLSYGRINDENKKAVRHAAGISALARLIRRAHENETRELATGTLWNLSSSDDLKRPILDEALNVLASQIIIPYSGWERGGALPPHDERLPGDLYLSTVFRNATGVLRNVSSAGIYARQKLRNFDGLPAALLYTLRAAIGKHNIDSKGVENCVCILRNLSYRCQEIIDPDYDQHPMPQMTASGSSSSKKKSKDDMSCFGASKGGGKKRGGGSGAMGHSVNLSGVSGGGDGQLVKASAAILWQPEVVQPYLELLSNCSNPETLEAAAGAIQNLAACYWQPSADIRATVRKEKGLPVLVELLRMDVDRVVCAVATALRNLAIDERNKELIGKYAMRDLVQKLPSGHPAQDQGTSDDTIAAVLATLNEVVKKNAEFARFLYDAGGVDRLVNITRMRARYSPRVAKFSTQVLFTMWQHHELRDMYKRGGWKEADFVSRTIAAASSSSQYQRQHSPSQANNTLSRPMASQGGTRYEDRTLQRGDHSGAYHTGSQMMGVAPGASVNAGQLPLRPGEPVYAQVNRDRKKNRNMDHSFDRGDGGPPPGSGGLIGPGDSWV